MDSTILILAGLFILIVIIVAVILLFSNSNEEERKFIKSSTLFYFDESVVDAIHNIFSPQTLKSIKTEVGTDIGGKFKIFQMGRSKSEITESEYTISKIFKSDKILDFLVKEKVLLLYKEQSKYYSDESKRFDDFIELSKEYEQLVIDPDSIVKQRETFTKSKSLVSFLLDKRPIDIKECFVQNCKFVIKEVKDNDNILMQYFLDKESLDTIDLIVELRAEKITNHGSQIFGNVGQIPGKLNMLGRFQIMQDSLDSEEYIKVIPYLIF